MSFGSFNLSPEMLELFFLIILEESASISRSD